MSSITLPLPLRRLKSSQLLLKFTLLIGASTLLRVAVSLFCHVQGNKSPRSQCRNQRKVKDLWKLTGWTQKLVAKAKKKKIKKIKKNNSPKDQSTENCQTNTNGCPKHTGHCHSVLRARAVEADRGRERSLQEHMEQKTRR